MLEGSRPWGEPVVSLSHQRAWAGLGSLTLFGKVSQPQGHPASPRLFLPLSVYPLFISSANGPRLTAPATGAGLSTGSTEPSLVSGSPDSPGLLRPHLLTSSS